MNKLLISLILVLFAFNVSAQTKSKETISKTPDPEQKVMTVEAGCGQCMFNMDGKGCDLAVRIDGRSYYVDGTSIHSHGDAHASDGFCVATSQAEVQGKIKNGRFQATYFKVIKDKEAPKDAK